VALDVQRLLELLALVLQRAAGVVGHGAVSPLPYDALTMLCSGPNGNPVMFSAPSAVITRMSCSR
jgi:hypothetical protein